MLEVYNPPKPYHKMTMKELLLHCKKIKKLNAFFNGDYNKKVTNISFNKTRRKKRKRTRKKNKEGKNKEGKNKEGKNKKRKTKRLMKLVD
jgi:hypothetical protein